MAHQETVLGQQTPSSPQYESDEIKRTILTVDVNALYSYAMRKRLPYRDFRWETPSIIADSDNGRRGFFVEVDLEYPRTLRRTHGP